MTKGTPDTVSAPQDDPTACCSAFRPLLMLLWSAFPPVLLLGLLLLFSTQEEGYQYVSLGAVLSGTHRRVSWALWVFPQGDLMIHSWVSLSPPGGAPRS